MTAPVLMSRFDWRAKGVPAAGLTPAVRSSGPKRSLKAICASSSIGWSRKSSTRCSSKASRIAANVASSNGFAISTPEISAPKTGVKGVMVTGMALSRALFAGL